MKKLIAMGCIMLVCGVTASNNTKINQAGNTQLTFSQTLDSLNQATKNLEASAERMNNSLSKIK